METVDKALAERMIEGDEAAFDELYRSYSGKLYRMAYFITGNRSDSEDVLQETFVKCFLHRKDLKQPERLEAWLCQILVRTAWRMEKRKKGKQEVSFDGILEQEENAGRSEKIQEDTGADGPLEQVLRAERAAEVRAAVERLDVKYRTIVLLYYYNGCGTKEIARITGMLEGTVKSRLFKARKLLRDVLSRGGDEELEKERGLCHG